MFDVSERKEAQQGLERALTRERDATRALREIDAMKNTFLHAVSHELRTPLASILGFAVTLEHHRGTLPAEETQELTKRLAVNARKLDRLLSDLLDLDRLDRGIIEPKWRPTDVGALVRHVVQESDLMVERNFRMEADPSRTSSPIPPGTRRRTPRSGSGYGPTTAACSSWWRTPGPGFPRSCARRSFGRSSRAPSDPPTLPASASACRSSVGSPSCMEVVHGWRTGPAAVPPSAYGSPTVPRPAWLPEQPLQRAGGPPTRIRRRRGPRRPEPAGCY